MTTPRGQRRISEGAAVVIASVVLTTGLTGVMAWRVRSAAPAPGPETARLAAALAEAQSEAASLRGEVAGLKAQLHAADAAQERLRAAADGDGRAHAERIRELEEERDALQGRLAGATGGEPGTLAAETAGEQDGPAPGVREARIIDANRELGYVVLDAGRRDGVREGMVFEVIDGEQTVARVRASDVREDLTGAAVEAVAAGRYPRPADRARVGQDGR